MARFYGVILYGVRQRSNNKLEHIYIQYLKKKRQAIKLGQLVQNNKNILTKNHVENESRKLVTWLLFDFF